MATVMVANAQPLRTVVLDSNTNAATKNFQFNAVPSFVKSFTAVVTKSTGAVAGKVYLQGTNDGTTYFDIDSLTLQDQATNKKHFPLTSTVYYSYRVQFTTTGTQKSYITVAMLRRPDEE
jgi:hypothetical protein